MKLRTKFILFFGTFLFSIAMGVSLYAEFVVGSVFKQQTTDNFRIIAEQSENSYLSFLGSMKVRMLDWTSDNTIRQLSKAIIATPEGSPERDRLAKEFEIYVSEKKMPYDETIFVTDLLDKNGIVVASTRPERIGENEKEETAGDHKAHDFTNAINSKFGEVFFGRIVIDEEENPEPTMNAIVRLFEIKGMEKPEPIDAVLLVYFENTEQIAEALGSGSSIYAGMPEQQGRLTADALLETYQTSNIYLVNSDHIMVTHSRRYAGTIEHRQVDTLPVRECFDNGKEISGEYDNYAGIRVLGSSMCFKNEGVMILVEVNKDEVYAPIRILTQSTIIVGAVAMILGVFIIIIFMRRPLVRINDIVHVAKQVAQGDLTAEVAVQTKDEIGYLALVFNTMITSIRSAQKEIQIAKDKIEREKAKDEALLASLGEGMVATDKSGNIIAINRMAEKMLGLKSTDVIGEKAVEVIVASDENGKKIPDEERSLTQVAKGFSPITRNMIYHRENDGFFPVSVTVTPVILEGNVVGSIAIFRDITKEKEIEKTREDLLSLASHQLRTPLSGTKWLIETLKRGLHGPLTAGQTEYLNEIYKINERMTTLVHDMLGVLRMEGDGAIAKNESVSTKTILNALLENLSGAAKSKQISIKLTEDSCYTINTDSLLLRNILESFVSNAINYSQSGNEVYVRVTGKPNELEFAIQDFGIGIPKEEQPRIFERFYRASNAKTFDTQGSGLGLYITAMLAKKIGATLSFESAENKGSTFYVHIPLKPAVAS